MALPGYPTGFRYFADSGNLNAYDGQSLKSMGFNGVVPYIGIGGGRTLPYKRLTRERYNSYISAGLDISRAFVEDNIDDADKGYTSGLSNAYAALADIETSGFLTINIVIAVNDKTTFTQADIDYIRGFRNTVGYYRCGVYGFSNFLKAVHNEGIASYYHQCGNSPDSTGTSDFVDVWQRNDGYYLGFDVNQELKKETEEDNMIIVRIRNTDTIGLQLENGDLIGLVSPEYQQSGLKILDVDEDTFNSLAARRDNYAAQDAISAKEATQ